MWISIIWSNLVLSCRLTKIIEKWCVNWNLQYIFLIVHLKALSGESQSLISPTMELTPAHFSHNIHVTFLSYCPKLLHCFFCFVLFSFCFFFCGFFFGQSWQIKQNPGLISLRCAWVVTTQGWPTLFQMCVVSCPQPLGLPGAKSVTARSSYFWQKKMGTISEYVTLE